MYFSFLAHFPITSLIVFTELSILLCYEVSVLKFYLQSFNLRLIVFLHFVCPVQFCRSCQTFLISLFCIGETALFTDLGLIDTLSASQNAEIVACILLGQKSYA